MYPQSVLVLDNVNSVLFQIQNWVLWWEDCLPQNEEGEIKRFSKLQF
jgi:hypothetical protein